MSNKDIIDMDVVVAVSGVAMDLARPSTPAPTTAITLEQRKLIGILGDVGNTPGCGIAALHTWPEATRDELFTLLTRVLVAAGGNRVVARELLAVDRDLLYGWLKAPSFVEWQRSSVNMPQLIVDIELAAHRRIGEVLVVDAATPHDKEIQAQTARFFVATRQRDAHHQQKMALEKAKAKTSEEWAATRKAEADARAAVAAARRAEAEARREQAAAEKAKAKAAEAEAKRPPVKAPTPPPSPPTKDADLSAAAEVNDADL